VSGASEIFCHPSITANWSAKSYGERMPKLTEPPL